MGILDKLLKGGSDTVKAAILSESEFFNDLDNVPTDISAINIALGGTLDGGITGGVTMVSGASKSFKTCISLFCVAAFLKKHKDSACIFYDTEFGASKQYFESFGIDVNRVQHIPIENIEQLKFDMVNRLGDIKRKDKVIVFIDSIGNIASKKEVEDAKDEKAVADMSRAKALKSLWRIVTPMLVMRDIPCIAINHVYQTQEMYAKTVVSGGTGGIYAANTIWIITKSQEKDGTDLVGFIFKINIEKSRTVIEKSVIPLLVTFDGGISKFSGMIDIALESGHVVKPSNGWYQRVDTETGELIGGKFRFDATQTDEFMGEIIKEKSFYEFVKKKYKLNAKIQSSTTPTIVPDDDDIEEEME